MMLKKRLTLPSHGIQRSRNCLSKLALLSTKLGAIIYEEGTEEQDGSFERCRRSI
jgi:hypothetical protein